MNQYGEPWTAKYDEAFGQREVEVEAANGKNVLSIESVTGGFSEPVMERIVACVNACAGIPDEAMLGFSMFVKLLSSTPAPRNLSLPATVNLWRNNVWKKEPQ